MTPRIRSEPTLKQEFSARKPESQRLVERLPAPIRSGDCWALLSTRELQLWASGVVTICWG